MLERISHHGGDTAVLVFGSLDHSGAKVVRHAETKLRGADTGARQRGTTPPGPFQDFVGQLLRSGLGQSGAVGQTDVFLVEIDRASVCDLLIVDL